MKITNHILNNRMHTQSPNTGGMMLHSPKYLILHFTAGPSIRSAYNTFMNPSARGRPSAHIILGKKPDDYIQCVPFNIVAHHAGVSRWEGDHNLNSNSIGIEIVNGGKLTKRANNRYEGWWGGQIPSSQVVLARHRNGGPVNPWEAFRPSQIEDCKRICEAILDEYPSIKLILGHDDIAPTRKTDPGPAFPLERFKQMTAPRSGDIEQVKVTAGRLNVRGGPGTNFDVTHVIHRGQELTLVGEEGNWQEVKWLGSQGWVYSNFTTRI